MTHPFFDAADYPWDRTEATKLHKALYQAIPLGARIDIIYRQCGNNLPPLAFGHPADVIWREALHNLTTSQGALQKLCHIILSDDNLKNIHDFVRDVVNAEAVEPVAPRSKHQSISDYQILEEKVPVSRLVHLPDASAFGAIPFDLGSLWGLGRGSIIGLIAATANDEVYEGLIQAERIFADVIKQTDGAPQLPTRYWLRIKLGGPCPVGSTTLAQLWPALVDPQSSLAQMLRDEAIPEEAALGFYLESEEGSTQRAPDLDAIWRWCDRLSHLKPSARQIAIVVKIVGKTLNDAQTVTRTLGHSLASRLLLPIDVAYISSSHHSSRRAQAPETDLYADDPFVTSPPGQYLYAWIRAATVGHTELHHPDEQVRYRSIIELYNTLRQQFKTGTSLVGHGCDLARHVVADLDQLATSGEIALDEQLLELTAAYQPDCLSELVQVYSRSSRTSARRAAFIFARRADVLLDAWLTGVNWDLQSLPPVTELPRDSRALLYEDLTLALLRQYRRASTATLMAQIEGLSSFWRPELRQLVAFYLGASDAIPLEALRNLQWIHLAVRAELTVDAIIDLIPLCGFDDPVPWWFLATMPPTPELIAALLALDAPRRAIFGLCTEEEWTNVSSDAEMTRHILTSRRGRSLIFRS